MPKEDDDIETVTAWCETEVPQADVDLHLQACEVCQESIRRLQEEGPPGYSGGLAELGYEGSA